MGPKPVNPKVLRQEIYCKIYKYQNMSCTAVYNVCNLIKVFNNGSGTS